MRDERDWKFNVHERREEKSRECLKILMLIREEKKWLFKLNNKVL